MVECRELGRGGQTLRSGGAVVSRLPEQRQRVPPGGLGVPAQHSGEFSDAPRVVQALDRRQGPPPVNLLGHGEVGIGDGGALGERGAA